MSKKIERRTENPEFRILEEEKKQILTGYAAVFGQEIDLGPFTEEILPGAFTSALERGDDVRALFNHNKDLILARTPKTLELFQDEKGLRCRIELPNTSYCKDLAEHIRLGNISQMSFGFYILSEEFIAPSLENKRSKGHFRIKDVELFDVSPVTFPAYSKTSIELERSLKKRESEFAERKRALLIEEDLSDFSNEQKLRSSKIRLMKLINGVK